jgi:hypothetical protein
MEHQRVAFTDQLSQISAAVSANRPIIDRALGGLAGAIFGYAVSVGLGTSLTASFVMATIAAIGVFLASSLASYLILQTISLAALGLLIFLTFRFTPDLVLDAQFTQLVFLTAFVLSPTLSIIPAIKKSLSGLHLSSFVQLFTSAMFATIVLLLRERMPADSGYAFSRLYGMEDNAGISGDLAMFFERGLTSQVFHLGSVTNGLYVSAANITQHFGIEESSALLAPFTHWNLTLLFLAWVPLTTLTILAVSGKKLGKLHSISTIVLGSTLFAILFWPFIGFGHTSVITAGLFGAVLLGITLNRQMLVNQPFLFLTLVSSLSFIVGNVWFPLLPFSAAITALSFLVVLSVQFRKGHKRVVVVIIAFLAITGYFMLPTVVGTALGNSSLIAMGGATRAATQLLIVLWLLIITASIFWLSMKKSSRKPVGNTLFIAAIGVLLSSNIYLVFTGMLVNSGTLGYGANKYLMTSIAISLPVIWIAIISSKKGSRALGTAVSGLALAFTVSISQPDQGLILNTGVVALAPAVVNQVEPNLVSAIREALEGNPEHILCVSDDGQPMAVEGAQWNASQFEAYICTRWSDSLSGNAGDEGMSWRSTMINSRPIETLTTVRDAYQGRNVTVIRFQSSTAESTLPLADEDTWWFEYVDDSWRIISVQMPYW